MGKVCEMVLFLSVMQILSKLNKCLVVSSVYGAVKMENSSVIKDLLYYDSCFLLRSKQKEKNRQRF